MAVVRVCFVARVNGSEFARQPRNARGGLRDSAPFVVARRLGGEDLMVFATEEAALEWFDKNDPEGVAFEYEVIGFSDLATSR
jgi:hypothetical protein